MQSDSVVNKTTTGLTFLSGGSALNPLAAKLACAGLHATHIISAFDNGGSSRWLRNAFSCIAIGDIRNRLCAMSGYGHVSASTRILELFKKRLPDNKPQPVIRDMVWSLAEGTSDLLIGIPTEISADITNALSVLKDKVPANFDWRHGSIGNFLLVGRFLLSKDWTETLEWANNILDTVGSVIPVSTTNAHLGAELVNGRYVLGQDKLTDQQHPIESPIKLMRLHPNDRTAAGLVRAIPYPPALHAINNASAIVYSWGSFYTSVLPAFLVEGISDAVMSSDVPRILLLNPFRDVELLGMSSTDVVLKLNIYSHATQGRSPGKAVTHLIALRPSIISKTTFYNESSLSELERKGVEVHTVDCDGLPQTKQIDIIIKLLLKCAGFNLNDKTGDVG
jgi:CofD-related protein of GAK system